MGCMSRFAMTGAAALAMAGAAALAGLGSVSAAHADTTYVVQASSSGWGQASADARCDNGDQAVDGYGTYDGPSAYLSDDGSDDDGSGWYAVANADAYVTVTAYTVCAAG